MISINIFTDFSFLLLLLFLSASLYFLKAGIRELQEKCMEGFLYLIFSLFFIAAHILYLFNIPIDSALSIYLHSFNVWHWITILLAPSLITLFILFGIFAFLIEQTKNGLTKIFFGLTLLCFLYMLGSDWSVDFKGIIASLYCIIWFEVEVRTAR